MAKCRMHLFIDVAIIAAVLRCSQISAIQYTPIEIEDFTDCALILPNHDQYVVAPLGDDLGGAPTCITYDAINQAYADARRRIDISAVEDDWKPEEVAAVGQLLLDVSQQLTKQYNLNIEDIELGLPQIDTMKTDIADICPVFLSSISCRAGKYRRQDGLCNNVNHPTWGAANTPFTRLLPPQFADHVSAPRISVTGNELPLARVVSRTVHTDEGYHDHAGTLMTVAWGQFMDHDFTLMGTPLDSRNRNEPQECCNRPEHIKNPYCMEINIPEDDYFYSKFNIKCQDFVRAFPAVQPNCRLGSRNPFNTLTGVIDGNTVYGVSDSISRQLRAGVGGLLKMNPAFDSLGLKELLPMKLDIPDEGCTRTNSSQYCFLAGEIRVNEQLILACIHTLMAREHNRIATQLAAINPHWDDEILYQEARRIVVAEIQHITFNEFLPLILGKSVMEKYDVLLSTEDYWDGYSSEINPSILDAFSAAAYRFGHSLLPTSVERWSKVHKFIASKRLSELIRRPYDLYRAGVIDEYFMGLLNQVAQAMDDSVTQEVTNNLFKKSGNRFGLDLVSFNIQRGRDFGLPGYMYFRKHCGLRTADSFIEMTDMMPNSTIYRYMSIYEHPWDIDLWSGGVAELPLPGSLVGPTFACIIATQMNLLRRGDRFWYELPNQPSSFTPEQLQEIRKIKLSRVLCDNTDLLDTVQIYSMVLPDHDINPRVPCKSSILPKLDLTLWTDYTPPLRPFEDRSPAATPVNDDPSNRTSTPLYAYHIKTVAIIEGSNPAINVNDLLTPAIPQPATPYRADSDHQHHLSKRDTNQSHSVDSSANPATKNISKRHSYYPRPRPGRPTMTEAIMSEQSHKLGQSRSANEEPDIDNFFRKNVPIYDGGVYIRNRSPYRGEGGGGRRGYPRAYAAQRDEEDEEDKEQPMSLEEVDPDHESQFEEVPMMVNEHGNQKVMPESYRHAEDTAYHRPKFSTFSNNKYQSDGRFGKYPSSEHSFSYQSQGPRFHSDYQSRPSFPSTHGVSSFHSDEHLTYSPPSRPAEHPYKSDHSSFHIPVSSPGSFSNPPKFGTSHQYNSLADDTPHYYKHFAPSIRTQQTLASRDEFSSSYPANDYEQPQMSRFRGHDFSSNLTPKESVRSSRPSYKAPPVPQSLEEYHRLHNPIEGNRFRQASRSRFAGRVTVPQNDDKDEDEKDEKEDEDDKEDKDDFRSGGGRSKPFVSMNFKNLNLNDDGISIRHHVTPTRSRFQSEKPFFDRDSRPPARFQSHFSRSQEKSSFSEPDDSDSSFPNVAPSEGSSGDPQFQDPHVIKEFVNSIFHKDKAASNNNDVYRGFSQKGSFRRPASQSPYNAHFGERVKSASSSSSGESLSKPAQNILWHRKSSDPRERNSKFKSSIFNREKSVKENDDAKLFDDLANDFRLRQSKRDVLDVQTNATLPTNGNLLFNVTDGNLTSTRIEHAAQEEVFTTVAIPADSADQLDDDDQSNEQYWSEPYSLPDEEEQEDSSS